MTHIPKHPAAFENDSGALGMNAGDRIIYKLNGKHGVADEFLHDGDCFVSFDDGTFSCVGWSHLQKEVDK